MALVEKLVANRPDVRGVRGRTVTGDLVPLDAPSPTSTENLDVDHLGELLAIVRTGRREHCEHLRPAANRCAE